MKYRKQILQNNPMMRGSGYLKLNLQMDPVNQNLNDVTCGFSVRTYQSALKELCVVESMFLNTILKILTIIQNYENGGFTHHDFLNLLTAVSVQPMEMPL